MGKATAINSVTNDAAADIATGEPYAVEFVLIGTAALLFHRYGVDAVEEKSKAKKGSVAKRSDNVESYVYRDERDHLSIPGEYVRMALVTAAKSQQDPRSPRKSMADLYKAGIIPLTELASLGVKDWDYLDRRRVVIQRSAITRERPALRAGWRATFVLQVLTPEYISEAGLHDALVNAGRLVGLGDFRPTFGRFRVESFKRLDDGVATAAE